MSTTAGLDKIAALDKIGPLSRHGLRSVVAKQLLTAIFRAELPAGTRLIVQKLARQFGVSSTPVREAIVELDSVGMVTFEHSRGAVVKPFGPDELRELYQIRRILEVDATRTACGRLERDSLEPLKQEIMELRDRGDGEGWAEREMASDRCLHELIAEACGSRRLADEIRRYNALMRPIRELVGNRHRYKERALREHLSIIDALLKDNADAAADAMARHINSAAKIVVPVMFGRQDQANRQ